MAPNVSMPTGVLHETDEDINVESLPQKPKEQNDRKVQLVWRNIILFAYLHLAAVYGLYLLFTSAKLLTVVFGKLNLI